MRKIIKPSFDEVAITTLVGLIVLFNEEQNPDQLSRVQTVVSKADQAFLLPVVVMLAVLGAMGLVRAVFWWRSSWRHEEELEVLPEDILP